MIKVKNLTKNFNGRDVLSNLSLQIKKGKTTVILGHSGVGKTTFLNALAGITEFEGEITSLPKKIAYAFQNPSLAPTLTVKENIKLVNESVLDSEIDRYLTELEIIGLKDKLAKNLSFGEKQRVNFIRALVYNAELLLIDESFSSLDLKSKLSCERLLKEHTLKNEGVTVIIVTHDVSLASSLADEIVVLFKDRAENILIDKSLENGEKLIKEKLLSLFFV